VAALDVEGLITIEKKKPEEPGSYQVVDGRVVTPSTNDDYQIQH